MKNLIFKALAICFLSLILKTELKAQSMSSKTDYTGYIQKYDTSFNGIGPKVYLLPHPPTKQDTLNEIAIRFNKISTFNDTLKQALDYQDLLNRFEKTRNSSILQQIINSNSTNRDDWQATVDKYERLKDYDTSIGLLNEYAEQFILNKETDKAEIPLLKALALTEKEKIFLDKDILESNLAALYVYNKKFVEANKIVDAQYQHIKKEKSIIKKANSLLNIAMIQAYTDEPKSAENTIIKGAIPLFNKAKDYDNKINAWVKLAQIYTLHKKYPEAQWFLIQAQELADSKNITKYNIMIEYLLGTSKYYQNNLAVSKKELNTTLELAKIAGDKYIELSTVQILGEINLKQQNIDEAEYFLKSYWKLRNELF